MVKSVRCILKCAGIATLAACAAADDAAPADPAAIAPNPVRVIASEYSLQAPDSIATGWTTFHMANRGEEIHYGHIVRLEPGRTVEELEHFYREAIRTSGPRPTWIVRFGGPGGTFPGDSANVTQYLEPGEYVWICPVEDDQGNPHFARGEVKTFVVHSAPGHAADRGSGPEAGITIRLVDHAFAVEGPLAAGRRTIRVENAGGEAHDMNLLKLAPGRTVDDVRIALNPERARRGDPSAAEEPPSPESLGSGAGGVAAIAPGMAAFFEADLTPGDYVLFCMVTAPDGRSHIEHGMIRQIRVE